MALPILFIAIAFAAIFLRNFFLPNKSIPPGTTLPPGPKGLPLLGSLLSIPPYHSWLKFFQWSQKYGPVTQISIAGRPHILLSTEKVANDLLRTRSNIYSSREQLPMAAKLLSDNLRPLFLPYNDLWRSGRKVMHHLTMSSSASSYEPVQISESIRMLRDLIKKPEEYEKWFERYAAGLMLRIGFGKMLVTGEESYVKRILRTVHTVERVASPGAYLVDTLPWLMWLPDWMAPFKREGNALHAEELDLFRGLQDDVRREMMEETLEENFTSKFLGEREKWGLSDDEGAYVIGTLFEAGAGTTAAAMMSFILAMVLHPSKLLNLQKQIDKVVGEARLPTFEDIPNLPLVRAVVKETLRWHPVTAGGVPHQLTQDDIYELEGKKYFLCAGSNVHANQWAIHRDPDLYPSPDEFLPERWLEAKYPTFKEPLTTHPNIQGFSSFGFGRRICPGINIAERSLNLLVSRIAWVCDIKAKEGWKYPEYDYTKGFNVQPNWFPFELKARNGRGSLVDKEYSRLWTAK